MDYNNLKLAYLNCGLLRRLENTTQTNLSVMSVYLKASTKIKYKKCGSNTLFLAFRLGEVGDT